VTALLVMGGAAVGMVLLTAVAVIRMQRSLDRPGGRQGLGSVGDAFGNFIDVFDPARARADRDLDSKEHQGEILPAPDADDLPVTVDLESGTARIKRR